MIEEELLKNEKIIDEINYEFSKKEESSKNGSSDRYMSTVVYCSLTGDDCDEMDCSECDIARGEQARDIECDIIARYPVIATEAEGIKFFKNYSNTVIQINSVNDLLKLPKFEWVNKLDAMKDLDSEVIAKYGYWNSIKDVCLELDEVVEYWYLKDYPLIIVCKNATYLIAPMLFE